MALWNKVLSGFNADDETVNFGARAVAENNGSIFETSTLATIQSEGEIFDNPRVFASIRYSMLCVAVDKSMTIFGDETCQEIVLSIGFDSPIITYCMSDDGYFLLIALAGGVLYCLHLPSGGKQVFDENIAEKFGDSVVKIFVRDKAEETNVVIVTASGVLYRIEKFNAKSAHSALVDEDDEKLNEIVEKIEFVKIFEGSQTTQAAMMDAKYSSDRVSIATIGKNIHLWPSERLCAHFDSLPFEYSKIQFFEKLGLMICLRNDGFLGIVCLETLLGIKLWTVPIADFVIVQDESNDPYQLVVLTRSEQGAETTLLQLLSFPDFECKFEIPVPTTTYLVEIVGCSIENVVFLEGVKNSCQKIETIRVKAIVENKPEYRLERLLRRERFAEAELFAKQFKLSLDSVNAAKAAVFVTQLGPWSNATDNAEKFENFIASLDKINDVKYIYDCCNNALMSNYWQTRQLLLYVRRRITQSNLQESNDRDFVNSLSTLNGNLRKLETFELIRKITFHGETDDKRDIEDWIKFWRTNLLQECVKHLTLGELEIAAAIWIRHLPEFSPLITASTIYDILNSIPETISPSALWPWLRHFIPSVTSLLPASSYEIILWAYKKTRSLEKYNRREWPKIGLEFARRFIELLSFQHSDVSFNLNQQYASKDSHLQRLMILVRAMTDLLELKTRHRIVISLETYLDDPTNVVHSLLGQVHVDAMPSLIETFLQQYMTNNSLKNDQVFCSYVQKTLKNLNSRWFYEKDPWIERVSIVIRHIRDIQNRLQQTVDVLKKAAIPWRETVHALAKESSNFDHPLVSKIRKERDAAGVKLILKRYGYDQVGLCPQLFRFIIKRDDADTINVIRELTKNDNYTEIKTFCSFMNHHLQIGNIDRAMKVLQDVEEDVALKCCREIVCYIIAGLSFKKRDAWLAHYIEALGPVEVKLREILSRRAPDATESNNALKNIPILRRIYKLEKRFNVWISHNYYYTGKEKALDIYIDRLISDVESENQSLAKCCENLEKVSDLLGLSALASALKFFDRTKDTIILKSAISRMARNGITSRDESIHLKDLCKVWITNADRDPETSMHLVKLCISNYLYCDEEHLSEAALCYDEASSYLQAIDFESIYKPEMDHSISDINDQGYALYTIYKDAAVSSGSTLLPLFKDSSKIVNFYADGPADHENSDDEVEIKLLVKSLMERVKRIQNEHHGHSLLRIVKKLHYRLSESSSVSPEVMMESRALLSYCLYTLLRKVVGSKSLDVCLGLSCLFMLTEQEASKWLTAACRSFQGDLVKHREVVNLGYEYYRMTKQNAQLYAFDCQKLLHHWGRRLTNYGISYKEMFSSDMVQKRDILERVMNSRKSHLISLLEDFCEDFGFNKDDCFLLYLQVLLSNWQPQLNFTNISGRKELKINESDVRDLNRICKEVAAKIKDKPLMKRHLAQLSPQINFYHYEVFLIMLELLGENNIERIEHFCFLQNYTRYGRPTEFEREAWASLAHDNITIPPISQWRLPFLPMIDQFKIITPELNLKTYEKWLTIGPTLKIQSHVICTLAIKGSVTEAWENYIKDEGNRCQKWSLYPRNGQLLKDIKNCIKCMGGSEGLYYGTAALYFVVNHTPQGADQVAAAQECFALAQIWESQTNNFDEAHETMIVKVKDKYLRLTSKHILYSHGVGEEKYLNLIGNTEKLIRELYNDPSIPERWRRVVQHRPDINSAADALGRLFSINMIKLRYDFLLEWLRSDTSEGKHNESMTMGFGGTINDSEDDRVEEDDFLRACYILQFGDRMLHAKFLIDIGFESEKDDGYGVGIRFRALRVLRSTMDENTLQDLTKHDSASFERYTKTLQYLVELERLGLAYSVGSFDSCSKHKLARILLKTQYYTPRALSLIIRICIEYGIEDHSLINATLEQMIKQSMAKELEMFLPVIGTTSATINCPGYITGWQLILANPFAKLDVCPTTRQIADCIESLRLLHACPVISQLEFKDMIARCIQCRQGHLAAALLPFLSDRDKDRVLREIGKNFDVMETARELSGLTSEGILVVPQALAMLMMISSLATERDTT